MSGTNRRGDKEDAARSETLAATQKALLVQVQSTLTLPPWSRWWTLTPRCRSHACRGLSLARGRVQTTLTRVALIEPTVIDRSRVGLPIWATVETAELLRSRYVDDLTIHVVHRSVTVGAGPWPPRRLRPAHSTLAQRIDLNPGAGPDDSKPIG